MLSTRLVSTRGVIPQLDHHSSGGYRIYSRRQRENLLGLPLTLHCGLSTVYAKAEYEYFPIIKCPSNSIPVFLLVRKEANVGPLENKMTQCPSSDSVVASHTRHGDAAVSYEEQKGNRRRSLRINILYRFTLHEFLDRFVLDHGIL